MISITRVLYVTISLAFTGSAWAQETAAKSERMPLWPGKAPVGEGKDEDSTGAAALTVFRPDQPNGAAIVICPGGGYGGLVTGPEGTGIARWLNAHHITGIVLEYRLPHGRQWVPLLDAQQAIRMVRANARKWSCDPQRVGIMGFSAGGHLAATAATHVGPSPAAAGAESQQDKESCRPDFAILIYPVISLGEKGHGGTRQNLLGSSPTAEAVALFSNEKQVTAQTPPAYMAHAVDDKVVPIDNSRLFHQALQAKGIASRLLELPSGDHGLNGYKGPMWDAWQTGAIEWLAELKMIPRADAQSAAKK